MTLLKNVSKKAIINSQTMQFDQNNNIVKLFIQDMNLEEKGNPEEASRLFLQGEIIN